MPDGPSIVVPLSLHSGFGLLLARLQIGRNTYAMFVSGSPMSGIASAVWDELVIGEHLVLPGTRDTVHGLDHVTIAGAPVPRFAVRRSRRATAFRLDGELGLNFFQLFREACFQLSPEGNRPMLMTLTP